MINDFRENIRLNYFITNTFNFKHHFERPISNANFDQIFTIIKISQNIISKRPISNGNFDQIFTIFKLFFITLIGIVNTIIINDFYLKEFGPIWQSLSP